MEEREKEIKELVESGQSKIIFKLYYMINLFYYNYL